MKKNKEIEIEETVEEKNSGELLILTADENNPVSDGKEYKDE